MENESTTSTLHLWHLLDGDSAPAQPSLLLGPQPWLLSRLRLLPLCALTAFKFFENLTPVKVWSRRLALFLSPAASSAETNLESLLPLAWERENLSEVKGKNKAEMQRQTKKMKREKFMSFPFYLPFLKFDFSFNSRTHLSNLLPLPYIFGSRKLNTSGTHALCFLSL